jgi:hypothetical protein
MNDEIKQRLTWVKLYEQTQDAVAVAFRVQPGGSGDAVIRNRARKVCVASVADPISLPSEKCLNRMSSVSWSCVIPGVWAHAAFSTNLNACTIVSLG